MRPIWFFQNLPATNNESLTFSIGLSYKKYMAYMDTLKESCIPVQEKANFKLANTSGYLQHIICLKIP